MMRMFLQNQNIIFDSSGLLHFFFSDYLDDDETREAELLSQIAELEQKLLEAELPKKEARIRSSLSILRNSSQKEKDEVDKSELESQIVQLEQKLSEAELTKQEALNQLGQVKYH